MVFSFPEQSLPFLQQLHTIGVKYNFFVIIINTRQKYRDIIILNLAYCQKNKGLEIYAWVIMSNHIQSISAKSKRRIKCYFKRFQKLYK